MLATDRSIFNFDFTGLPDNINCWVLTSAGTKAAAAKWRKTFCHGANFGQVTLGDGSVQQLNDPGLIQTLMGDNTDTETGGGTLQFFFP